MAAAAAGVLLNCISRSRSRPKRRRRQRQRQRQEPQSPLFIIPTVSRNRFNIIVFVLGFASTVAVSTIFFSMIMIMATKPTKMTTMMEKSSFFPAGVRYPMVDAFTNEASFIVNMKSRQRQRRVGRNSFVRNMSTSSSTSVISGESSSNATPKPSPPASLQPQPPHYPFPMSTRYKFHPALSNVALAQSLWATVVRPGVDCAIDATCGNGHDSVAIANLLFGSPTTTTTTKTNDSSNNNHRSSDDVPALKKTESQLLCLDVQERAVVNTTNALSQIVPQHIMENNIQVLHASHEFLPRPRSSTKTTRRDGTNDNDNDDSVIPPPPVGLIVYNLGWLPSNHITGDDGERQKQQPRPRPMSALPVDKACITQMDTTISSLCDAVRMIRVGGMVSVVTYPKTNPGEHQAVQLFMTCLALLSSNIRSWEDEIDDFIVSSEQNEGNKDDYGGGSDSSSSSSDTTETTSSNSNGGNNIASIVRSAMERVITADGEDDEYRRPVNNQKKIQTFRVACHNRIGMDRAPILITATRIK